MISFFRTAFTMFVITVVTIVFVILLVLAALIRIPNRPGSIYDVLPRVWGRVTLWAAGVKVHVHGLERLPLNGTFIFICNHVSLFDILALVGRLPRNNFVAKAELFKIPVFGSGLRILGTVPIERDNQKAAFGAYDVAAARIRAGSSVVVFPEGTRGTDYAIRRFKKGPFVLAIKSEVPIVPVVLHGTLEILPKGKLFLTPGIIDLHLLEAVPTAGLTYRDRDQLADTVQDRMQTLMNDLYLNQ
jgi:1-acyl-sn-glycerol-3-phosphate acyltransferase